MSEFKIKPQNVRSAAQDLNRIAKQMKSLEDQIWKIQNGLSFEVAQKERIRQRLKTARNSTASHYKGIYSSTSTLNSIVNTYETTERRLAGSKTPTLDMMADTVWGNIKDAVTIGTENLDFSLDSALKLIAPGGLIPKLLDPSSDIYTYEKYEEKDKFGTKSWTVDKVDREKVSFFSINKDELKDSDIKAFKLWEHQWKDTQSAFHDGDTCGDKDGTHASYNIDVLKRETSAELYGGLYYTDPETGKKKLRAAAGGSFGFTISALSLSEELQLGDSNLGGYLKADVAVGKAEVKGSAVAGLRDADGNFNPTLHGKLSAEAIAAEASAKAGVKIAGTDVGVKASVNVGIGAHAEAGFKDGKFSLDIGASFGVGASVKLEIDVSGTVNAVSGAVQSAWSKFTGWFR